jgi:hypothetical protein
MTPDNPPAPKQRGWLRALLVLFIAFDGAVFFQWECGAFQSELGGHRDEAAHFLAGARVRERITRSENHTGSATANAPREELVALSRSPVFSLALGGWMTAFGASRTAALLFMAALAAATAALIFCTVFRELGGFAAATAALLWLCAPAVRESFSTILPEQLYALAAALLLWSQTLGPRKPPGLAFQSPDGSSRQEEPPRRLAGAGARIRAGIAGGCCVFAVCIAFKLMSRNARAASEFLRECVLVPGIAVAAFAAAGMVFRPRSDERTNTLWPVMTALTVGVLFARWLKSGEADARTLVVATPVLAMLAVRGAISLAGSVGSRAAIAAELPRRRLLWLFLLALLSLSADFITPRQKEWQGFGAVARALLDEAHDGLRVLVVSDPLGEGMLVSELAVLDRDGRVIVERGSETLANPALSGPRGRPMERFLEDEQLFAHLTSGRIRYIVLDSAVPQDVRAGYHDQMRRVVEDNVRSFWPIYDSPIIRDGEPMGHPLRIYRVMQSEGAQLR